MNISSLINKVIDVASAVLIGRVLVVVMMGLVLYGYTTFNGIKSLAQLSNAYDLNQTAYIISARECYTVVDVEVSNVVFQRKVSGWPESHYKCFNGSHADMINISREFKHASRGASKSNFIFYYASFFVLFILGTIMTLGNTEAPNLASKLSRTNIIVSWILICGLLFPITFSDYKSSAIVNYNGVNYLVQNILLSKDKKSYISLPYNRIGQILSADGAVEYNIKDIH